MRPTQTVAELAKFEARGAGSDAERRAARWLAREIEAGGRRSRTESFWCRPNWALAHAWHVTLGLAGSLVAVSSPRIGGGLLVLALVSILADELTGLSPGRRLTPERASQNVIGLPAEEPAPDAVRLIIAANYDAGRTGVVYRTRVRQVLASLRGVFGGLGPGWLGWLCVALAWLVVIALLRLGGARGSVIGVAQLIPTVGLVVALALLLEIATSAFSPAAGDNASGTAVALAVAAALDAGAPGRLAVELVFSGAGPLGMRRYLRARRRHLRAPNTIVLGIAACGEGQIRWWTSDGPLVPMRYLARLRQLCARLAGEQTHLLARAHRGRGVTPALAARAARLPAIAIGCLDERGLVPRSHTAADAAEALQAGAMDSTLHFALMLVDEIDAYLAEQARPAEAVSPTPVTPV